MPSSSWVARSVLLQNDSDLEGNARERPCSNMSAIYGPGQWGAATVRTPPLTYFHEHEARKS